MLVLVLDKTQSQGLGGFESQAVPDVLHHLAKFTYHNAKFRIAHTTFQNSVLRISQCKIPQCAYRIAKFLIAHIAIQNSAMHYISTSLHLYTSYLHLLPLGGPLPRDDRRSPRELARVTAVVPTVKGFGFRNDRHNRHHRQQTLIAASATATAEQLQRGGYCEANRMMPARGP